MPSQSDCVVRLAQQARAVTGILIAATLFWPAAGAAQGPNVEYFYHPDTILPWAECSVTLGGGSTLSVPFLPVVLKAPKQAPAGTSKYTRDVSVDAPMVFGGSGIVDASGSSYDHTFSWAEAPLDLGGRAVLMCYDCTNSAIAPDAPSLSLGSRVEAAASRGAAALVLFSSENDAPFLLLDSSDGPSPEIPIITVSRAAAASILDASGQIGKAILDQLGSPTAEPESRELIARLRLRIDGAFDRFETDSFRFLYRSSRIEPEAIAAVAEIHEKALDSIRDEIGTAEDRDWPQATTVYFTGFDSKLFFTHHWGAGLSNEAGAFLRWKPDDADPGLIAHEHAHTFTSLNWGDSSSFMEEGVARHVEARVTDTAMNHQETRCLLEGGRLPPLVDLLHIDVGSDELTPIAYPAAGSLAGYLVQAGGLDLLRMVFALEGRGSDHRDDDEAWQAELGKPVATMDHDWRAWLRKTTQASGCDS